MIEAEITLLRKSEEVENIPDGMFRDLTAYSPPL